MSIVPQYATAAVITPTGVFASTYYDGQQSPNNLINNSGLDTSSGDVLTYTHASHASANGMWHAGGGQGIGGSAPVVANQYVVLDLGANYDLTSAYLWQMIQPGLLGRGIKDFALYASSSAPSVSTPPASYDLTGFTQILDASTLALASGSTTPTQTFSLSSATNVRQVYIDIISAHSGLTNDYVGLSEIKFEGTAAPPPPATLYNWTNAAGGFWQTGSHWSPSGPPTPNDDAAFAIANTYTVTVTSTPAVRNLNISAGDVTLIMFNNAATLQADDINVSGGKLTVPGLIGRASLPGVLNYTSSLNITDGGQVVSTGDSWGGVSVGADGATVHATVSGAGSSLSSASGFYVGAAGDGTLDITAGGKVTSAGIMYVGRFNGTGIINVDGTNSALTVSSDNILMGHGAGTGFASLTVTNGGQVSGAAEFQVGAYGGKGAVVVGKSDGTDTGISKISATDMIVGIGGSRGATLTVNPKGVVELSGHLGAYPFPAPPASDIKINLAGGTIKTGKTDFSQAAYLNWTSGTLWYTGGTSSTSWIGWENTDTLTVPVEGLLKGSSNLNGRLTVLGTISPGDDHGVATFNTRNLTIGNNIGARGTFAADIDFANNATDLLSVTGTVNLANAALVLSLLDAPANITTPLTFLLIANDVSDAVTGTFTSIDLGAFSAFQYTLDYAFSGSALNGVGNGNDVAIIFTAIPEPTGLLPILAGAGLLARRRSLV